MRASPQGGAFICAIFESFKTVSRSGPLTGTCRKAFCARAGITTLAVHNRLVTIPAQRKIRARIITVQRCNTALTLWHRTMIPGFQKAAAPGHQLADPFVIGNAFTIRFFTPYAYFIQNAFDFRLVRQCDGGPCWIGGVEDQAAKGARQLVQREGIRVF